MSQFPIPSDAKQNIEVANTTANRSDCPGTKPIIVTIAEELCILKVHWA